MKVLVKKIKKVHFLKKFFYFLSVIAYIATLVFMTSEAFIFKSTEPVILAIILALFIIWGLVYILFGLITMLSKSKKGFILLTIFTLLLSSGLGFGAYYLHQKKAQFSNMNANEIVYTSNLIILNESKFSKSKPIGMIESTNDIEGNVLAQKLIEKEKLTNEIYYYEDYQSMISDLYKGKIIGCFVSGNYDIIFEGETFENDEDSNEKETPLVDRVKVYKEYSEVRENEDIIALTPTGKTEKTLTEPFTVLIMGVDSAKDGLKANQAFNGDTLILATFNPNTLTATMFSLPRDLYVPIACNHNRYAKINSSAAYGSSCVIKTIQKLTDIEIDYYVKINFTGVVQLIDALGGVTVNVEEPDFNYNGKYDCKGMICEQNSKRKKGSSMIYVPTGVQHLNGEQALAYARNRHQFAVSDIARNQHQQQVIEAAAKQLKNINSITEFENILETISNNIETNMSLEQIISFYSVGKDMLMNSNSSSLSIKKTYLSYYNLNVWLPGPGRYTSALGYWPGSLEAIVNLMKENLGTTTLKPVKTFSIDYNEDYSTPLVGRGIATGERLHLAKNFVGASEYEASTWCESVGLTCYFETRTSYETPGIIIDQSLHKGELLITKDSMTFYKSDGLGTPPSSSYPSTEPDINIDSDGDGSADTNIDTDGDGSADSNLDNSQDDNTTTDNETESNTENNTGTDTNTPSTEVTPVTGDTTNTPE